MVIIARVPKRTLVDFDQAVNPQAPDVERSAIAKADVDEHAGLMTWLSSRRQTSGFNIRNKHLRSSRLLSLHERVGPCPSLPSHHQRSPVALVLCQLLP